MALLVRNPGVIPVTLVESETTVVVPAGNLPVNVTSELRGLSPTQYEALESQRIATGLVYYWTGSAEYEYVGGGSECTLTANDFSRHASSHASDGSDPIVISSSSSNVSVVSSATIIHETFLFPDSVSTVYGTCGDDSGSGTIVKQPSHPTTLQVTFPPGNNCPVDAVITVTGLRVNGSSFSENFLVSPTTVVGSYIFAYITSISNSRPALINASTILISAGPSIGLSYVNGVNGCTVSAPLRITTVEIGGGDTTALASTISSSNPNRGSFIPTDTKNGNTAYEVWYSVERSYTVVDNGHSHVITVE